MINWYRKAAEQNYAWAQCNLGVCYANGQGVAKDEAEAVKWYRKAAEQNYAGAQYNLGVCYVQWPRRGEGLGGSGEVVSQSCRAELRHGSIQSGPLLRNGEGVAKDYAEAVKWYRKAAEQNLRRGSIQSGRLLLPMAKAWRRIMRKR